MFYRFVRDAVSQEFDLGFKAMKECLHLLSDGEIDEDNRYEAAEIRKRLEVSYEISEDFYRIHRNILEELKKLRDQEEELIDEE